MITGPVRGDGVFGHIDRCDVVEEAGGRLSACRKTGRLYHLIENGVGYTVVLCARHLRDHLPCDTERHKKSGR